MDAVQVSQVLVWPSALGEAQVRRHILSPWNLYSATRREAEVVQTAPQGWEWQHNVLLQWKKTSERDWPEPARIIALIHQDRDQESRRWFGEALIRKATGSQEWEREGETAERGLHVGPLLLFHSPNWLLLRKRSVFHVPVSLRFCLPVSSPSRSLFLTSSSLTLQRSPGTTALEDTVGWFQKQLFNAFFPLLFTLSLLLSLCCYFHFLLRPCFDCFHFDFKVLFWKSVGCPEFVNTRGKMISHCRISMTNIFMYWKTLRSTFLH